MCVFELATAQPTERTPNKFETEINQNTDDVGTGDPCGTCSKQCRYLHHRKFCVFWFLICLPSSS